MEEIGAFCMDLWKQVEKKEILRQIWNIVLFSQNWS